jgi:hypothetical protein
MRNTRKLLAWLAAVTPLVAAGCGDEAVGPDPERVFVQIERLGNPLVSEVTLAKRNHGFHNTTGPTTDVANFTTELEAFITGVAGREQALADLISSVLLPDMLIVQSDKAAIRRAGSRGPWPTATADGTSRTTWWTRAWRRSSAAC